LERNERRESVVPDVGGVKGGFLEERLDSGSLEGGWKQA